MSRKIVLATSVLCALALLLSGQRPPRAFARPIATGGHPGLLHDAALEQHVRTALGSGGLRFEENVGQTDPAVKFFARGSNYLLALSPEEAALRIHTPHVREKRPPQLEPEGQGWADAMAASALVHLKFIGGAPDAHLTGLDAQAGTINYMKGKNPSQWHRKVPHFGRVRYESLYPGVDAVFYGDRRQMEFDFVVAAGADPSAIRMRVEGAGSVSLTEEGGVEARTPAGMVTLLAPRLYQQGGKSEIGGRYVWRAPGEIGFELAPYNHSQALVFDPTTNVTQGGSWQKAGQHRGANQAGGHPRIMAPPPPATPPPTGGSVALSTLLGGVYDDSIQAMVIGATSGHVYVAGWTDSSDFPLAGGQYQDFFAGSQFNGSCFIPQFPCGDAFVAEFDVSAITAPVLVNTTYLGGQGDEAAWGIALDANDNVYVVGETNSGDFPMGSAVSGFQTSAPVGGCSSNGTLRACHHVFFVELDPTLATLNYSTYFAGTDDDEGYAVAVDSTGLVFLTGVAGANFPICDCNPIQPTYNGGGDAFFIVLDPTIPGSGGLLFDTYLGGDGTDVGFSIAVDGADNAYIGGVTYSTLGFVNFPTTSLAFGESTTDTANCGPGFSFACGDGFVVKTVPPGFLQFSTFLSGSFADQVNAIALDTSNNVYATGQTQSFDF
ncbi:MAG TPA: SBBP repeat-containing protein, partial [Candidatus Solibacter sp.]|nr:SBBP repeat-containing protein [Candidatus Solibacter sp.]